MGGHDRRGRWRIAKRCTVINVTGGSHLDLCAAELARREIELNVPSVMGGGEIRAPNGVDVQVSDVGGWATTMSGSVTKRWRLAAR